MQNNEDPIKATQYLRIETAQAHTNIEGAMPVMQSDFTLEKYIHLLQRLYGFYSTVETAIIPQVSQPGFYFSYSERTKLPALKADLNAMGVSETTLQSLPKISSDWIPQDLDSVLGLLYVLEGSTLGGQVISRHLKTQLQLGESSGLQFFSGYGPQTGLMWKSFQAVLNQNLNSPEKMKRAADTAQMTFQKLGDWLKK